MGKSASSTERDVIIVGGGISGAALAYGLAGRDRRITVLDAPTRTNMASRTNVGLIWCQSKFLHLPEYAKWGFMSSRLYPQLLKELEEISEQKVPARFTGGLIPVLSQEDFHKRADYIAKLREALGEYRGGMIERAELEKKLPGIGFGPEVCGAAWCEEDGVVDPLALLRAYLAALPRQAWTMCKPRFSTSRRTRAATASQPVTRAGSAAAWYWPRALPIAASPVSPRRTFLFTRTRARCFWWNACPT